MKRYSGMSIEARAALGLSIQLLCVGASVGEEPSCDQVPACRQLMKEGQVAHKHTKDYQTALQRYQSAYEIIPDPRLFALMGRSHHRLGNFALALSLYHRAWSVLNAQDQQKLMGYIQDAEFQLQQTSAPPATAVVSQQSSMVLPRPAQRPSLPRWRLGLGLGLAGLSLGTLSLGIAANTLHGRASTAAGCEVDCVFDMTRLIAPGYTIAALLAVGATFTLAWPSRGKAPGSLDASPSPSKP